VSTGDKSISEHKFWVFRIVWVVTLYRTGTCTGTGRLDGEIGQVTGSKSPETPGRGGNGKSSASRAVGLISALRVDVDRAKTRITHTITCIIPLSIKDH